MLKNGELGVRAPTSSLSDFGLTVRDCLAIAPLDLGQVVAGEAGLDRRMDWVHVVDHADIEDSLANNELLLTSGIALSNNMAFQQQIFDILERRNSAALVVALGGYIAELPQILVDAANRVSIPLITIPWAVNFSEITRALITRLVQSHYEFMVRAQELNRDLLQIIQRGEGLVSVCEQMSRSMGCGIHIYNEAAQSIARCTTMAAEHAGLTEERIRAALVQAKEKDGQGERCRIIEEEGRVISLAVKILVGTRHRGWLVLESGERSSDPIYLLTGEIGATVVALVIRHADDIQRIARKRNESQLLSLLDGNVDPNSDVSVDIGLLPNEPIYVFVIEIRDNAAEDALQITRETLKKLLTFGALAVRGHFLVGVAQKPRGRKGAWIEKIMTLLVEGGYDPRIGIGPATASHDDIPADYLMVRDAMKVAQVLKPGERIILSDQMIILTRAMRNLTSGSDVAEICPSIVKLNQQDRSLHGSLIEALSCFLDLDGNVSLAARTLGIHRHTMLYRLNRISEILNVELDSTVRLELRLQLVAWEMARK